MRITRLSWAGLWVQSGNTNILIDPLENIRSELTSLLGNPLEPVMQLPGNIASPHVFVTHVHADHFDIDLISWLINDSSILFGPSSIMHAAQSEGLTGITAELYEPIWVGDLSVTAVPAVDWIGDEQVSWVITEGKKHVFHGGDTSWHGYWWHFARLFGAFDAVFLPVNGVVGTIPHFEPASDIPGSLTPKQAVTAAMIMRAKQLTPIHYNLFNNPPKYIQHQHIESELEDEAHNKNVVLHYMNAGESIEI